MTDKPFTGSLSRSQGRSGWTVIFRHPVRIDPNTKKPGLRVRQGLGTDDEQRANEFKDQLNVLLADRDFRDISARPEAERRFAPRVVEIFFYGMTPHVTDFAAVRDEVIALPNSAQSAYRTALLLGTTGAGKTTLLRQIMGTDPETERFPSTSNSKTTVHDTEILLDEGAFRAAVTFFPVDEVREHLNECMSEAVLTAYRKADDREITRALMMHVNQRFRFNYVLGNGPRVVSTNSADDDDSDDLVDAAEADSVIDMNTTNKVIGSAVDKIKAIAHEYGDTLKAELGAKNDETDQRVVDELFEVELDRRLREDENFHTAADSLMDEIDKRFDLLKVGTLQRNKQGWPVSWSWESKDRKAFLQAVTSFSSNYSPRFGKLLTPLVNGVRVAGPFTPDWIETEQPKLVLLDGEGLGHTPNSVATISTSLSRRIEAADAVVLVDNAEQPMQAAPIAAMRDLVSSGNASKLLLVFTRFDRMDADNLPNNAAKEEHVLASAKNVLAAIGEELGSFGERALRERLGNARFFVGGIDKKLTPDHDRAHRRTVKQLRGLLDAIDNIVDKPEPVDAKPVYDRLKLALFVTKAAENFRDAWWPRLGLASKQGGTKEHWKRIWALSLRLSTVGREDEYDTLKPVADLRERLQTQLYVLLQHPIGWNPGPEPTDDKKQQIFDELAQKLKMHILELATRRIRTERFLEWQSAFVQSGRGSSYARASIIGNSIYQRAAPIPDVTPSLDQNGFLKEVADAVANACEGLGATLR